jgi:2-oxoglutarate dehydrogenase E2 component (dihydrolipoamide succinyltransferase)
MSNEVEIRAPAEQTEGTRSQIQRWLKSVGDTVQENEPLIELETDKVTVEVASPGSGTLREILKQEQEEIEPGELLGRIEVVGAAKAAGGARVDEHTSSVGADRASATKSGEVAAASAAASVSVAPGPAAQTVSPAVRRLLAERGLDVSQVRGTGLGGRVTVEDVLAHGADGASAGRASAGAHGAGGASVGGATAAAPGAGSPSGGSSASSGAQSASATGSSASAAISTDAAAGPSRRVPHTATRKRIAEHMVQSLLHTAPHVTTVFEADLTTILEDRARKKDDFAKRGAPLTLTAYFLQATVAAIKAVPEANSRWTDSAVEIYESMNVGVGTALETGLVVPVLRDVQTLDLFATAKGLNDLVTRARDGGLTPADMRGGTFTISNHGVGGSLVATPIIINQPQSAILGIGKLEKRPVVLTDAQGNDTLVIRQQCYVTLTIDHRVMDGHQANRFLQTFVAWLAKPSVG